MLKWGWDTKKTELVNLTRFGCIIYYLLSQTETLCKIEPSKISTTHI